MKQEAAAMAVSNGEKETRQKPSNALESNGIRRRLNQIDKVRARGIGEHIALPQLVVCGDQSAGKSSVLEGITRIPFPRNDGLCTKFATEIILRHSQDEYISIHASIIPHSSRLEEEALRLKDYHRELTGYEQLPEVIEEVSKLMGVEGPSFAADVLRIEVNGPTGLHLTVVDLPGLIAGSDDNQIVESLVDAYLESPRTIILTVVPASSDIETQPIMRKARHFDTEGERTVGIITKPDLINKGTEGRVALLAKNQGATQLKLGFFLLKNPSPQDLVEGITPESRQQKEVQFFKGPIWHDHALNFDRVGINSLRSFLQSLLERHIEKALPDVRSEISALLDKTQRRLDELGEERPEISDQRLFLSNLGMKFRLVVQSAVDGTYQNSVGDFFGRDEEHIHNRLRAEIHILNEGFSDFMRENAQKFTTREWKGKKTGLRGNNYDNLCPLYMAEEAFLDWIMKTYQSTRGQELPGCYNHTLLAGLFHEQSSRWAGIARSHVRNTHKLVSQCLERVLQALIMESRLQDGVQPIIVSTLKKNLDAAVTELETICEDEKFQPLTYNHYFTDNIQKDRLKDIQEDIMTPLENYALEELFLFSDKKDRLKTLITQQLTEVDMRKQACKEAKSALDAYYKVAMKTFVDNVCRQVIERHIVRKLPSIFDPMVVLKMSDEEVQRIAAEPTDKLERRKELTALVDSLEQSLIDLR